MSDIYIFSLRSHSNQEFFSSRTHASLLRKEIQMRISTERNIVIDFENADMTQSFADELIGVLAFLYGQELFKQLKFRGCSEELKKILNFVVQQRLGRRETEGQRLVVPPSRSQQVPRTAVASV